MEFASKAVEYRPLARDTWKYLFFLKIFSKDEKDFFRTL